MKLYNDNCITVLNDLIASGTMIDHAFTSPPYNRKRNDKYALFDDIQADYLDFNIQVMDRLLKITKGFIFYNIQSNYYNREDVYKLIGHYADKIRDIHIWEKSNPMPAQGNNITNAVEFFLIIGNSSLKSNKTYTKNIITTSVNSNMPKNHKAIMKPEVADHFISNFTKPGEIIIDPFMGLGTTGVSCAKYGREFMGIELCTEYFNIAKEKLTEITE